MTEGTWQIILSILDAIVDLAAAVFAIKVAKESFRSLEKGTKRRITVILSVTLALYMLWVTAWDYSAVYGGKDNLLTSYPLDPLVIICVLINVMVVYIFYKKDKIADADTTENISKEVELLEMAEKYKLSAREIDVLLLINKGKTNPQIGEELFIAENTVKRHIANIFKKTDTSNRYELIAKKREGL